ncbi:DUF1467 family protein [Paracoccaceae bacterium]
MTITAALILFSVTWFMVLFCVLPVRFQSQGDRGQVTPGTPASAPEDAMIGKKAKITTVIATVIFALLYGIITSGWVTVADMDIFGMLPKY